ncbi:sensor histidine kinase [Rhodohalobacter sp. 614A]|uniref:sensor histidine kinase n=1 Tax=Rhodohalobacter sp. 614A TaxID=2908649 RepID=UPI001F34C611|nr:sensor histidine kinase [Rhodohalobacter sp. 614A]
MATKFFFREYYLLFGFIILLFSPIDIYGQVSGSAKIIDHQYIVGRGFTTENGLPANGVNSVFQDRNGYIWAATYNGLVQYNGSDFKLYNTSTLKNLRSNRFTAVTQDLEGRIWAGLEYSNFLMIDEENDSTITYLINQEKFGPSAKTNTITFDSDNRPWIGTTGGLITIWNDEVKYLNDLPNQIVKKVIHTEDFIYVLFSETLMRLNNDGSVDKIIARLSDDTIYFENSSVDDFQNVVSLVDFEILDESIYLLSEASLIKYDDEPVVILNRDQVGQSSFQGFNVYNGTFYIYGRDGLLETNLSDSDFIYSSHYSVVDLILDHEESIWIATTSNGIRQYTSTPIYQGPDYEILDEQGITAVLNGTNGSVYVGTNCDGVYEFNGTDVNHYSVENGIENVCVWSLMEEEDGTLWAGTWGGGVYYKSPGQTMFEEFTPPMFENVSVFLALYKDRKGNIWFGTYHSGLFRYDGTNIEAIFDEDGELLSAVRNIYETEKGGIVVATDEGIGLLTDHRIIEIEEVNLLETSNFRTIAQDSNGRFYFGSYGGGLIIYSPGENPITLSTRNGLYDDTVSQLNFDKNGNLWLGGNLGIFFIEKNQVEQYINGEIENVRVSRMGVEEGMTIRETNGGFMPSSQMTVDGKLIIPTVQGVNVVDTNQMELNSQAPGVFVEEVEIDGEIFFPGQIKSIPYSAQRIIFRFSALSYQNPEYNRYEYRLEGFDKNWHQAGNEHEAIYSSLPAGNYSLKVRASNNDGFWSAEPASISFQIFPPFWQTAWFYLSMVLLFGAFLVVAYRYRVRSIQKNNRVLQNMVDERTEELSVSNRELKKHIEDRNKLHSILAHDLRNPFAAILGYIELIRNEFEAKDDREYVEMMNMLLDSGRNTLSLLENLLQWSSAKEGGLEANFEAVDVTKLVDEAISMTDAQSAFKNIFVRNLIDESHYVWADRNMILSVIRNLLSNAIKFSGRDSIVEISLREEGEKVIVSVEDSGVGIPEEEIHTIFSSDSRIQQKVGTQGEKGIGMGLVLCKEFIAKHSEKIWVESTPRKGSTFSFSLKKVPEYQQREINRPTN